MTGLRIVEAHPEIGTRLMGLEAAMKDAAIELAIEQIHRSTRKGASVDGCFRCGVHAKGKEPLKHQSSCAAGKILAYVEAVCEQRMSDVASPVMNTFPHRVAAPALTGDDRPFVETYHVEYEVEEHHWAGEEGNSAGLGPGR